MRKRFLTAFIILIVFRINAQINIDSTTIYFNQKKYEKTLIFCSNKKDYHTLYTLGDNLYNQKDFTNSLLFYLKANEIGKKYFNDKFSLLLLEQIGFNYQDLKDYNNAVIYFEQVFNLNNKMYGEYNEGNFSYLAKLILNYNFLNNYKKSIVYLQKATKLNEFKYGINDRKHLISLNNLAYVYSLDGQFQEAEILFKKIVDIRKITIGENHPDYALSLSNLATTFDDEGKYNLAEPLHTKSLEIRKEIFGDKSSEYLISLNNLGNCYLQQGKFLEAELIFEKVLKIRKETIGEDNLDYCISLTNLAVLYVDQGKYSLAEPLYNKALELNKKFLGIQHPNYASSLSNLAVLYVSQGMYAKAEPLQKQAVEIRKIILGNKHPDYASSLQNLAAIYVNQNKYSDAEVLYKEALVINEEVLGSKHPDYATSLDLLAQLYRDQKKYSDAEPLFLKALDIRKEILGEKNSDYALTMSNLAIMYELQDKHTKAEPLFLKALEIRKEILGENHPGYISSLFFVANFYRIIESNEKAANYYEQFMNSNHNRMIEDIYSLSEKDLINYIDVNRTLLFSPLSFLNDFPTIYPKTNNNCFENELLVKNLSLRNNQLVQRTIQKTGNKLLKEKYEKFITNKIKISKLNEIAIKNRKSDSEILISENEILEKDLIKESGTFFEYKKLMSFKWNDLKVKLKSDEITIDLVSFKHHKTNTLYAAFVLKKDSKFPKFISLFEEKQLDFLLSRNKIQPDSTRINKQYLNQDISNLFLKPLENELEGVTTIYLSPSGLGNQIDFAALPIKENLTFGEKFKLHVLSSPVELMDYKVANLEKKNKIELLLYGGIDYTKSNGNSSLNVDDNSISSDEDFLNSAKRSGFEKLPGTLKEVDGINANANKSGFNSKIFKESEATEESIKALDGKKTPYVLHLATHGYFFPDPVQEIQKDIVSSGGKSKIYKASEDPMMRSGLLLAGAKNYWGKSNQNNTIEDGILTASEISNLDLSACQLVVLSACETGLGEVKGSEGVFGLQRAFKMAGVKNIIMSLWKVPDTQTAALFDIFYSECFAGKSIHEAFQSAQAKMKANYSPYYWAGFVLLE
ncbi:CHAT domain containing protein [Flavobacteriaceae bacterium]